MHADSVLICDRNIAIAVEICTSKEFKTNLTLLPVGELNAVKKYWDRNVEKKASNLLKSYELSNDNYEKVMGIIFCIAMRMLTWVKYFNGIFNLSKNFYIDILTSSVFTPEGIIDEGKVVTVLMDDESLSTKQKFLLACHYCMKDRMPALLRVITKEDRQSLYNLDESNRTEQYGLIRFWCYFLMGEIDKLKGKKTLDELRLDCAIASGSITAVRYCLEKTTLRVKKDNMAYAASRTLELKTIRDVHASKTTGKVLNDWTPFSKEEHDLSKYSYVPSHYSTDILFYLFRKLTSTQRTDVLGKFYRILKQESSKSGAHMINFVNILFWPHQDEFMDLISSSWEFLPENIFGALLLEICSRIEAKKGNLFYGEDKCFDYRKLLMHIWCSSPDHLQKYVFSYRKVTAIENRVLEVRFKIMVKVGVDLISNLYSLPNFNSEDNSNIKIFLSSLPYLEREIFIDSPGGKHICTTLLQKSKFELFDELIFTCFKEREDAIQFRKKFGIVVVKSACLKFIKNNEWDEAEKLVNWSEDLSETEVANLKEEVVRSVEGKELCRELFIRNEESGLFFVRWGIPKDYITDYKVRLLIEADGMKFHEKLLERGRQHFLHTLVNCCLNDKIEKRCFRAELAKEIGFSVCRKLIVNNLRPDRPGTGNVLTEEEKWEPVDRFTTWCLPSRNKLTKFKKNLLDSPDGKEIIFDLMKHDAWKGIDQYLTWLTLLPSEIKELKEKLLRHEQTCELFDDIMDMIYPPFKGKLESIANFLRFFLIDRNAVKEFEARYHHYLKDEIVRRFLMLIRDSLGIKH